MPLNPRTLLEWPFAPVHQDYGRDDAIRYALSVGLGADPMDERQLAYLVADRKAVLPTFTTVLAVPGPWTADPRTGVTRGRLVHGEQAVRLFRPLPASAQVVSQPRVVAVSDRGVERGAVIHVERDLRDAASGELLARLHSASVCRGDGGFGGEEVEPRARHEIPQRPCDVSIELPTARSAALLYQLNGDRNPLHTEPAYAARAGFASPILHGLCTFGMTAQALQGLLGDYRDDAIGEIGGRFSAPVIPGDTLRVDVWRQGDAASFRVWAVERGAKVLDNGLVRLGISSGA